MISEVTSHSAMVWIRTEGPMPVSISLWRSDQGWGRQTVQGVERQTRGERDFIEVFPLEGLVPGVRYEVRVTVITPDDTVVLRAQFKTAQPDYELGPVKWVWSGDLGGQGFCRRPDHGYDIFDHMREATPAFAILLGDVIYADGPCPAPPNIPGSDFVATTLEEYRVKHRYQREDQALQRFLAEVPIYAQWDDHEVRNDISGVTDPLIPVGLEAFLDYWPTGTSQNEPRRLYRQIHRGGNVDLFFLDTRQYRSLNTDPDGPGKTMLGKEQLAWFLEALPRSLATWKIIISSVPLSLPKGEKAQPPAVDSWAPGRYGTGFSHERNMIVETILAHQVSNVVWLTTDVHFAQVLAYDPRAEGKPAFHEFVCGPLSAGSGHPGSPEKSLNPTVLYGEGGFFNFGEIVVDQDILKLRIVDNQGATMFQVALQAQR